VHHSFSCLKIKMVLSDTLKKAPILFSVVEISGRRYLERKSVVQTRTNRVVAIEQAAVGKRHAWSNRVIAN
jgi:hypothetical protein